MSDKEYLAKRFDESFRLGKEVGEMMAGSTVGMDGARRAVEQAEENIRMAVKAFQAKEKEYRLLIRELGYLATLHLTDGHAQDFLKRLGLDAELINLVIAEHEDRRQKNKMRSES